MCLNDLGMCWNEFGVIWGFEKGLGASKPLLPKCARRAALQHVVLVRDVHQKGARRAPQGCTTCTSEGHVVPFMKNEGHEVPS